MDAGGDDSVWTETRRGRTIGLRMCYPTMRLQFSDGGAKWSVGRVTLVSVRAASVLDRLDVDDMRMTLGQ